MNFIKSKVVNPLVRAAIIAEYSLSYFILKKGSLFDDCGFDFAANSKKNIYWLLNHLINS